MIMFQHGPDSATLRIGYSTAKR